MTTLTLDAAQAIVAAALTKARSLSLKPLAVAVLDARGALKAFAAEEGTSLKRGEIAIGKAHGTIALGVGSRAIMTMAIERPHFVAAATHAAGGSLVPVPGGVLIRNGGEVVGAVGISGDTSDNDEVCVLAGIAATSFSADTGA